MSGLAATLALTLAVAPAATSDTPRTGGVLQSVTAAPVTAVPGSVAQSETTPRSGLEMPLSYPYQPTLREFEHDPDDRSYAGDLIGYADIAPRLNAIMADSDRVSTQVIGQSSSGRDLYLVTVTAPEKQGETKAQTAYREMIENNPEQAATTKKLHDEYKTPIWFSANIHGNEWEGTDASLNYIEELATAPADEVSDLLEDHRIYFSVTLNPDGRNLGTRATALGFDANRDMITNVTPESESYVRTTQELLPLYASDLHGYTSQLQVEPTGPPHGENYEYDLYIPHNYALALQIEQDVVEAAIPGNPLFRDGIKIPYRDTPSGWDDYPPIFTAQYAAFYGALTATVELPLGRQGPGGTQTPERAAINTAVAEQVLRSSVDYVAANSDEILDNQIEVFRRGVAGDPKTSVTLENLDEVEGPDQWKPLWDITDNQDPVDLPRAYVIPVGEGQRSMSDATALVEQLLLHGIEVKTLNTPTTLDGTTYPRGSYLVDMHQPTRGLANALLDLGTDISPRLPSMYDISAWSLSYLWGATVDKVGSTTDGPIRATTLVDAPTEQGSIPKKAQHVAFDVAGVNDYRALNELLAEEAVAWLLPSGQAVISPESYNLAVNAALEDDIAFRAATSEEIALIGTGDAKELDEIQVGYVGTQEPRTALSELGFDAVQVSSASITQDPGILSDLDVIWVSNSFTFNDSQVAGREAVQAWVDEGHALVGSGNNALTATRTFGLVTATGVSGNNRGNGIVAVDTPEDSILANYAQDHAFIYPALSFTDLGEGTRAEQTYDEGNPLLAGHWRSTTATNGPEAAAGNASVISARLEDGGTAVVFGTSPFFRVHPKGGMSQVAQTIFWAVD